ncbi:hypothetical protein GCM10027565_23680 [Bordetella tumulicola]
MVDGINAYNNKDYGRAVEIFKKNEGNPEAKFYLYRMYSGGLGVEKDKHLATKYLEQAAIDGCVEAMEERGYLMVFVEGGSPSRVEEGLALLTKAKDQGYRPAMADLGRYYISLPDREKALKGLQYLEQANVAWELAMAYRYGGPAFERNQAKALGYWKAVEADPTVKEKMRTTAAFLIDEQSYYGSGTPENAAFAAQRLSKRSDPQARALYAWMLFRGDGGLTKNPKAAVQIWEKLKDDGGAQRIGSRERQYVAYGLAIASKMGLGTSVTSGKVEKPLPLRSPMEPMTSWCVILMKEGLVDKPSIPSRECGDWKGVLTQSYEAPGPSPYQELRMRSLLMVFGDVLDEEKYQQEAIRAFSMLGYPPDSQVIQQQIEKWAPRRAAALLEQARTSSK